MNLNYIDQNKITIGPGYCKGGSDAVILGSRIKNSTVISLYGSYLSTLASASQSDEVWHKYNSDSNILLICGAEDQSPSPEICQSANDNLVKKGVNVDLKI